MTDPGPEDPRKIRSRNRLLDAAAELLLSGGVEAVTIDAVTRVSKVARTTLYRHFDSSTELLAATFDRLLPPPAAAPAGGSLRTRLIEQLNNEAILIDEVPLQLTMLAWLALSPNGGQDDSALAALRQHVIEQQRAALDELLRNPDATAELGDFDVDLAQMQLVGPIVAAKLVGIKRIERADCAQIVDDFLAARKARPLPGP